MAKRRGKQKAFSAKEPLFVGVDTHKDTHTAVVVDALGRRVAADTFSADATGYGKLEQFLSEKGEVALVAIEGLGSYGAGLASHLKKAHYRLIEALKPGKRHVSPKGKDDDIDAESAARQALADYTQGKDRAPKDTSSVSGELSWLLSAREDAVKSRSATACRIQGLLVRAPEPFRAKFRNLSMKRIAETLARMRPKPGEFMKLSLRSCAERWIKDDKEADKLEGAMSDILKKSHPALLNAFGVSTITAATLIACAGDNPERFCSEASFACFCGVCPISASSGKTQRHRLNRGGDRRANRALYQIALVRLRYDSRTAAYAEKKRSEGLSTKEILRCLKRYIAREVYHLLCNPKDTSIEPGEALKERRLSLGLTQKQVASALGTYPTRVSRFERGAITTPEFGAAYAHLIAAFSSKGQLVPA